MTQRELKFRVWDGKDMREPPPLNEWDMEDGEFWVEYCDNPIMQFTGLQDKNVNAKDIYECDILAPDGTIAGNKYENEALLQDPSYLLIEGMGTRTWRDTEQAAMERGCQYAQ